MCGEPLFPIVNGSLLPHVSGLDLRVDFKLLGENFELGNDVGDAIDGLRLGGVEVLLGIGTGDSQRVVSRLDRRFVRGGRRLS